MHKKDNLWSWKRFKNVRCNNGSVRQFFFLDERAEKYNRNVSFGDFFLKGSVLEKGLWRHRQYSKKRQSILGPAGKKK